MIGANLESIASNKNLTWKPEQIIVGVLLGAYAWEFVERFLLEPAGLIRYPEIWYNRWISDPLVGVVGAYLGAMLVRGR